MKIKYLTDREFQDAIDKINLGYAMCIHQLENKLSVNHVPFYIRINSYGLQLLFPWCSGDVACTEFTYESTNGYVESYRFPWDDEINDVTVENPYEMAKRIIELYNNTPVEEREAFVKAMADREIDNVLTEHMVKYFGSKTGLFAVYTLTGERREYYHDHKYDI